MMLDQRLIHAPGLDHRNLDLDGADRVTYLLEQTLRYDYPGPVQQLRHRLVVTLCHLLALPARYVSGHLLGQGGRHAWVEVVIPQADHAVAMPFDPCNGVPASAPT